MHIIHTNKWTKMCVWMLVSGCVCLCVAVCVCLHTSTAERSTLTNDYCGMSDIAVCVRVCAWVCFQLARTARRTLQGNILSDRHGGCLETGVM